MLYVAEQFFDSALVAFVVVISILFIFGFYLLVRYIISKKRVVSLTKQEEELMNEILNRDSSPANSDSEFLARCQKAAQKCAARMYSHKQDGVAHEIIVLIWVGLNVVGIIDITKQTFDSFVISESGEINTISKGLGKSNLETPPDLVKFIRSLTGQKAVSLPPLE